MVVLQGETGEGGTRLEGEETEGGDEANCGREPVNQLRSSRPHHNSPPAQSRPVLTRVTPYHPDRHHQVIQPTTVSASPAPPLPTYSTPMSGYTVPPPNYAGPKQPEYGTAGHSSAGHAQEPLLSGGGREYASGSSAPRNDWGAEGDDGSDADDFKIGVTVSQSSQEVRAAFVRKVYSVLFCQIVRPSDPFSWWGTDEGRRSSARRS